MWSSTKSLSSDMKSAKEEAIEKIESSVSDERNEIESNQNKSWSSDVGEIRKRASDGGNQKTLSLSPSLPTRPG